MKKQMFYKFIAALTVLLIFGSTNHIAEANIIDVNVTTEKKLNVYYANWSIYGNVHQGQQVKDLPWDRLSTINHSFWRIEPSEDHTAFSIVSIDENADLGAGNCFDQYAEMTALYPDVDVVLAIGGWADTKWFADMAKTPEGRASFIRSCIETMRAYPFLSGIDIDWEYPGTSRNYEGEGFLGSSEDEKCFTALMQEMRETFDSAGFEDKIITYCAPAGTGRLKSGEVCIDFAAVDPFVDRVNIMSYDMAGSWSRNAMHHSPLYPGKGAEYGASVAEVVEYLISLGVSPGKINIGSPLYSQGWVVNAKNGADALGKKVDNKKAQGALASGQFHWFDLVKMETSPDWEAIFDEESAAAYLFNTNPDSIMYQHFLSYESQRSLQAKIDYVNEMGLGGMIVWASGGDSIEKGYPMLTQMAHGLGLFSGEMPGFDAPMPVTQDAIPTTGQEADATDATHEERPMYTGGFSGLFVSIILALLIALGAITLLKRWVYRR